MSEPVRLQVTAADGSRHIERPDPLRQRFPGSQPGAGAAGHRGLAGRGAASGGKAADAGGLASIEYALDGGDFTALSRPGRRPAEPAGRFRARVPLSALADGPHLLAVRAADRAGNAVTRQVAFHKDSVGPDAGRCWPPAPQDPVNGLTSLIGRAEDAGRIARVEVSEDGKSFREVSQEARFRVELNLSLVPADKLLLRCTDAAGNVGQLRRSST